MIYCVFSIHDEKAEAFLPPFILPNANMAKRVFADCINSDTHQFGSNPADFTLFELGQFDDSEGQFLLQRTKKSLGNGVEFRSLDRPKSPEIGNGTEQETNESVPPLGNVASIQSGSTGQDSAE